LKNKFYFITKKKNKFFKNKLTVVSLVKGLFIDLKAPSKKTRVKGCAISDNFILLKFFALFKAKAKSHK